MIYKQGTGTHRIQLGSVFMAGQYYTLLFQALALSIPSYVV